MSKVLLSLAALTLQPHWQLLRLLRTFCSLCCPSPPALARQAERSLNVQPEIRVPSPLVPCAEPFSGIFQSCSQLKGWGSQARPGWQCPRCPQAPRAVQCCLSLEDRSLLCKAPNSPLQPKPPEAELVWMSLVIKVLYLSTPWQFVPVWCMRKGPSGAKPQIKCVLKLNLQAWMWMFHNLSCISIERTIVWF